MFKLDLTSFLLVRRYIRRSPCFMYSVMRQRGSWIVTQPMRDTTWGFCPSDTFFIISISRRKSRLSLPFADTTKGMKSFLSNWQILQCLSYLAIDVRVSVLKNWRNKVCEDSQGHTTGATMHISLSPWPYTSWWHHNNLISSFQSTISPFMYCLIGLQWVLTKVIHL